MSQHHPLQKRKNSGVTWIGDIPAHWQVARIKAISTSRNARQTELPTGALYIGLEDVESGSGSYRPTAGSSRKSDDSTVSIFKDRDVLYGKLRPYLKKAIVAQGDGACSTEFLVLDVESKGLVKPEWLHGWLLTHDVTQRIEAGCDGAKMPRASWEHVSSIHIPVPPPEEQAEILESLDGKTSRIDTLIAKKTRFIELLKEKRQAIIAKAVTKGLDDSVEMKDSGVEWIGETPKHWRVTAIKWLTPIRRGASPRPIDDPKYFDSTGKYGWVRISDVTSSNRYLLKTEQKLSELGSSFSVKLPLGSLFLSIAGSVGKPCITGIDACIHDGFVYFPLLRIDPMWLFWVFEAKAPFVGLGKLGTQLNLNTETVGGIRVGLPPEPEMTRILKALDFQTERLERLIEKTERSIELLKEHRSALITAAVTGKIDVREAA